MGRGLLSVTVCLLWLPWECLRPHLKKQPQGRASVVGLGECLHFFTCCNFRKELKKCVSRSVCSLGVSLDAENGKRTSDCPSELCPNAGKYAAHPHPPSTPLVLISHHPLTAVLMFCHSRRWKRWFPRDEVPAFHRACSFLS